MAFRLNPRQLETFVVAAELHSFRQAALRLHLSPSAVSNLIAELESTLGFAVFERTTRSISLTPQGRRFLPSAQAVLWQLRQAGMTATDIRDSEIETVRMAAPLVVAAILLPRIMASLRQDSGLRFRIIDTPVVWLADRVAIGEADLAIGPDRETPVGISRTGLAPTSWVLWCRPDHPLAQQHQVAWHALAEVDVFAAGRDHEERVWPQLVERDHGRVPGRVHVVEHITTALGLAAAGHGVTFSPDYVAPLARSFGLVNCKLVEPELVRELSLYASERGLSRAVAAGHEHIVKVCAGILQEANIDNRR